MVSFYKKQLAQPKNFDNESKAAGFYQEALDHFARQVYAKARYKVESKDSVDIDKNFIRRE